MSESRESAEGPDAAPRTRGESSAELERWIREGDVARLELRLGQSPDQATGYTDGGTSLLLFALYQRQFAIAELIRRHLKSIDIFEAAALGELPELRRHLMSEPALVSVRNADGFTALHLAAYFGRDRAARFLLSIGADVNATTPGPTLLTPLHSAVASGDGGLVRVLLAAGANPDAQQSGGYTPLHAAAKHDQIAIATCLLAAGATLGIRCEAGMDALDFAKQAGSGRIERLLRLHSVE